MTLTFTSTQYGGAQGVGEDGTVLFTINPSMARGDNCVHLSTDLPGIRKNIRVEGPSKYDKETFTAAMQKAARLLEVWAAKRLGVTLTVTIVDNT